MNRLPYIPVELQRIILEFRGTIPFVIFKTEISNQKRKTEKWFQDILGRMVQAYTNDTITHQEWLILLKMSDSMKRINKNIRSMQCN
jgi:hypothetical protein